MASSPLRLKSRYHARSVSLPSRSHPLIPRVDEQLGRLRSSEPASSSLSSVSDNLRGLEELYDCLDDLLQLPQTHQAFAHKKWVEDVLDGYLRLLDVCATAKDVSTQTKQDVRDLLSVLRRRRDKNDFGEYLTSRKTAKKVMRKSLKDLQSIKTKHTVLALGKNYETAATSSLFSEIEEATSAVLESLLSCIAGTKEQPRLSLVSKLMRRKTVASQDEETNTNEFEQVDAALVSLHFDRTSKTENQNRNPTKGSRYN